jgi:hypothetical protein
MNDERHCAQGRSWPPFRRVPLHGTTVTQREEMVVSIFRHGPDGGFPSGIDHRTRKPLMGNGPHECNGTPYEVSSIVNLLMTHEVVRVRIPVCRCKRCGRHWHPRTPLVRRCRWCKSALWNVKPGKNQQGRRTDLENRTGAELRRLRIKPQPTDPPLEPMDGSTKWYESGPDPIATESDDAVLFVRIGMACNALTSQLNAAEDATNRALPGKPRDVVGSLASWCGYTNEAIRLASENLNRLRELALAGGMAEERLALVGKVTGGKHPASELLKRARNRLVFHWDDEVIRRSTLEYARNQRIVWVEGNSDFTDVIHRLSFEVLCHALFFEISTAHEGEPFERGIRAAIDAMTDAMTLIVELFTFATIGYMKSFGADARSRELPAKAQKEIR